MFEPPERTVDRYEPVPARRPALRVSNWRQFQHYRDRNPPWIKLHFALLSSSVWVMLDDASRALAIACMLVASRNDGLIHSDEAGLDYLRRVAYLHRKPNFKPLIDCGFLECASASASDMLANARPEERRDRDREETTTAAAGAELESPEHSRGERKIAFNKNTRKFDGITEADELRWQEGFPAVPIPPEIERAAAWAAANPANRKSNWERFLVNWFTRAQDKTSRVRR